MKNLFFICFLVLSSCQYFQPKEETKGQLIARVGTTELRSSTIEDLIPPSSKADSILFVEKFAMDWVKKQLMIKKAGETIDFNEAEIQQKVLDYQYALMVHELEKRHIDQHLNDNVSDWEIAEYYSKKSENFILRENLAKCLYFKFPSSTPRTARFRRYLKNYPEDSTEVWEFASQHAIKSFTEVNAWVKFDEVLKETPLHDVSDKSAFLKTNRSIETSDEDFIYFLKIFEYKLIGEVAPLEFIGQEVEDILINKRKIELKRELEKKIYEEAEQSNAFEIFSR